VVAVANWNELSNTSNPSSSALVDATGSLVPGMTAAFQGNANTFNASGVPSQTMLSGFLSGNPMTATFTNIPYARYDVYVYYAGFNNNNSYSLTWVATNTATSAVLSTQYSVRGSLSSPALFPSPGFKESNFPTLALAEDQATLGNGGNYLKFTSLTAASLRIAETGTGYFNENGFSGIQIVDTTPVAPTDDFAAWIGAYPAAGAATDFDDDADDDGIKNGLESYLGTNPTQPGPALTETSAAAPVLKFRHLRSNSIPTDITATYLWSADLLTWQTSGQSDLQGLSATITSATVPDSQGPANHQVEVTVTLTAGSSPRIFSRIQAQQTQ
jgi:hypothetical protein